MNREEWLPLPDDLPDDMTFGELMDLAPPGMKGFYFDLESMEWPEHSFEQATWGRKAEQLLTGQEP